VALDCFSRGCEVSRTSLGVEHRGFWWTESLMEKLAFTSTKLSNVKVIIMIMRVPVEELIC
jgi:hypothetical protein